MLYVGTVSICMVCYMVVLLAFVSVTDRAEAGDAVLGAGGHASAVLLLMGPGEALRGAVRVVHHTGHT